MKYFKIIKNSFEGIYFQYSIGNAHIKISVDNEVTQEGLNYQTKEMYDETVFITTTEKVENAVNNGILEAVTEKEYNAFVKNVEAKALEDIARAEQIQAEIENENFDYLGEMENG